MISFPNIKINLGLNVQDHRKDGYHDINTVMIPLDFSDILEILPSKGVELRFQQTGISIEGDKEENLCWRAAQMMLDRKGGNGINIHLHKLVPPGTGLGGGSSDAAHTLIMMNKILGAGLQEDELMSMAGRLGSDCPFFIQNQPSQATGKGEILKEIGINLGSQEIVLVLPGIHVSTSWAYSHIIPHRHEIPPSELVTMDIHLWKEYLVNDFEAPVFLEYPQLKDVRDNLYDLGAVYASMSGSGSSIYGIFNTVPPRIEKEFTGMKVLRTILLA